MGVSLSKLVRNGRRTHTRQFVLPAEESDPARRSMQDSTSLLASLIQVRESLNGMQSVDLPHAMDTTPSGDLCFGYLNVLQEGSVQ